MISTGDTTVPYETQKNLVEFFRPRTVLTFSSSHFWTVVRTWWSHTDEVVKFFDESAAAALKAKKLKLVNDRTWFVKPNDLLQSICEGLHPRSESLAPRTRRLFRSRFFETPSWLEGVNPSGDSFASPPDSPRLKKYDENHQSSSIRETTAPANCRLGSLKESRAAKIRRMRRDL